MKMFNDSINAIGSETLADVRDALKAVHVITQATCETCRDCRECPFMGMCSMIVDTTNQIEIVLGSRETKKDNGAA